MASPEQGSSTGLLIFLAQAIVVVVGWAVVHLLSRSRDRDKARREIVGTSSDTIDTQLIELLTLAHDYHTSQRNIGDEQRIVMTIQDIAQSVNGLGVLLDKPSQATLGECRRAIRDVRVAITGLHFADEHTSPLKEDDLALNEMASAVIRAKGCLKDLKHEQFRAARVIARG